MKPIEYLPELMQVLITPEVIEESWLMTYTGVHFNIFNYTRDDIRIEDIAHSLAYSTRFNGHARKAYSIAQHSVLVYYITSNIKGLLHDAEEYIFMDIPRPLKILPLFVSYNAMAERLRNEIFMKYDFTPGVDADIIKADNRILATEGIELMAQNDFNWQKYGKVYSDMEFPQGFYPYDHNIWTPEIAEMRFLNEFHLATDNRYRTVK